MTTVTHYGTLSSEKIAEENRIVREIVREISNFGINERQRLLTIYLLSLELENIDDLKSISGYIKNRNGDAIFLSGKETEDGSINS